MNATGIPAENRRTETHVWGELDRERAQLLVERAGRLARHLERVCRGAEPAPEPGQSGQSGKPGKSGKPGADGGRSGGR